MISDYERFSLFVLLLITKLFDDEYENVVSWNGVFDLSERSLGV